MANVNTWVEGSTGHVIVRLPAWLEADAFDDLRTLARERGLADLAGVLDGFNLPAVGRLVTTLTVGQLRELERPADRRVPRESLTQYWRLDLRARPEVIPDLVERLMRLPWVETAYPEPRMRVPDLAPRGKVADPALVDAQRAASGSGLSYPQGHLDPAPRGVGLLSVQQVPGGDGSSIALVDLEEGWTLGHVEFATATPTLLFGDNQPVAAYHGTAVLGVLVGSDDGRGIRGIVPAPRSIAVLSHHQGGTSLHVADAVLVASAATQPGDVVLVEVQTAVGEPIEVDPAAATAIRDITSVGRVVVLAAGNGNFHLDKLIDAQGALPFSPLGQVGHDTGSIMVGAAKSPVVNGGHERHPQSNYGSRVTCHAWGTRVFTAGGAGELTPGATPEKAYTGTFSNTSAAAAILAGVAALTQSMCSAATGTVLSSHELRALLSLPANGTPQVGAIGDLIGTMPDLAKLRGAIAAL